MFKTSPHGPVLAGLLVGLPALIPLPTLAEPPQPAPVKAQQLLEAKGLLEAGKYKEAINFYKELDKSAGGSCLECQLGLARAFNKLGAFKEALKRVDAVLAALGEKGDKEALIQAYNERGIALVDMAKDDPKQLEQAEKAFRQAYELSGRKRNAVRFSLAVTLLRLSRDAEGVALLKEYLEQDPKAPSAEVAKDFIANPVRARKNLIPDFELATLGGDYLTAEDLKGKVLLFDFWGTWCEPCRMAIPGLRSLARLMKADEPFVLVSVSTDDDEAALRDFIAKNGMTWPQVWDKDRSFTQKCGVAGFPTYMLVSHEGEIIYVARGWGEEKDRDLSRRISAAVQAARRSTKPTG